jgi:hypothetical protein
VTRLRNLRCYTPQGWTEVRTQLRSTRGILGALMGNAHPVVLAYGRFLQLYERLETRFESELDHAYGHTLGPALMVFHVQLAIRNWLACQLDVAKNEYLPPPNFCQGLHILEVQNNLMWLPTTTNVPALLALHVTTRLLPLAPSMCLWNPVRRATPDLGSLLSRLLCLYSRVYHL